MSYFVRKHDIANLVLVAGGILMFFFHMSALVWPGYNPWGPGWCWAYEGPVPRGIFLLVQAVGSIGAIFVIVLAYMWNKDHNRIFASVISFFMIFNIWSGVIHANTSFYGFGFGIPLVLSGLLVLFGGGAKYDRYTKILALGTYLLESDKQELSEEIEAQSEVRETEEASEIIHDESTAYCVSCASRLPVDAAFCIECGASQEPD